VKAEVRPEAVVRVVKIVDPAAASAAGAGLVVNAAASAGADRAADPAETGAAMGRPRWIWRN
jgi:hypothetical protein